MTELVETVARAMSNDLARRHYGRTDDGWDEQTNYHRNEWLAQAQAAINAADIGGLVEENERLREALAHCQRYSYRVVTNPDAHPFDKSNASLVYDIAKAARAAPERQQ